MWFPSQEILDSEPRLIAIKLPIQSDRLHIFTRAHKTGGEGDGKGSTDRLFAGGVGDIAECDICCSPTRRTRCQPTANDSVAVWVSYAGTIKPDF